MAGRAGSTTTSHHHSRNSLSSISRQSSTPSKTHNSTGFMFPPTTKETTMDPKKNPTANESPEKTEKWRHSLITNCLAQMGTAMGKEVPKERVLLYCRALNNLGEAELRFAFDRALEHLGEFLPSIEQLRTYAEQYFEATRERHLREHTQLLLM